MFDIFGWIRNYTRKAVLAGLADAVNDITVGAVPLADEILAKKLTALLPAPTPEATQNDSVPEAEAGSNGEHSRKKVKAK